MSFLVSLALSHFAKICNERWLNRIYDTSCKDWLIKSLFRYTWSTVDAKRGGTICVGNICCKKLAEGDGKFIFVV